MCCVEACLWTAVLTYDADLYGHHSPGSKGLEVLNHSLER